MTEKCANCRNPLDPKGVSLDFCSPRCQEKWQEQGTDPLPGIAPIFPAPTPAAAPPVARFKVEVAVEPAPQVPTQRVPQLEVPPSEPASSLAPAAVSPSRLGGRWPWIGRLRMGRRG